MNQENAVKNNDFENKIKKMEEGLEKEKENLNDMRDKCKEKIKNKELEVAGLAYDLNRLKKLMALQ